MLLALALLHCSFARQPILRSKNVALVEQAGTAAADIPSYGDVPTPVAIHLVAILFSY